jgi:hypothetical protein
MTSSVGLPAAPDQPSQGLSRKGSPDLPMPKPGSDEGHHGAMRAPFTAMSFALMPNSGRYVFVCLCTDLDITYGRGERQVILVAGRVSAPNAEYSPVLALWLVRLSACRSPGYGGPEGSHACASCPASTSRKKTRAVPRGGRAAARLHRQPIPRALTTPPAGTRKRSIAVQETGHCGCADGSVVTGALAGVRDLARIPGGHLGAGPPKVLSTVVLRRCEAGTGRLDQAAVRPSGGPPDPARPPRRRSPAQAHSRERSSASPASSPATL